jgi:hypothetical protein
MDARWYFYSFFIVFSFFVSAPSVFAQQPPPSKTITLATVNIQNAKITSEQGNVLHISFDLTNRVGMQTGVLYGVMLVSNTAKGQSIADQQTYPTSLTLPEYSSTHEDITYTAPPGLAGTYDVVLTSRNADGFQFAIARVGTIALAASTGVEIAAGSCVLRVEHESGSPAYALLQGVDIASTENLVLDCTAVNHGATAVSVVPTYETHYRTAFGAVVPQIGGTVTPITLAPQKPTTISLVLPKAGVPQAYDVLVSLKNGTAVSNTVTAHYVLRGESATIQTLTLDKKQYAAGDTAIVSFFWTPSADSFPGSRYDALLASTTRAQGTTTKPAEQKSTYFVSMVDQNNALCAAPVTETLPTASSIQVPLAITKNCINPDVSVDIRDASGKVLAHKELIIAGASRELSKSLLAVVFVGLLGVVAIVLLRKKIWISQ